MKLSELVDILRHKAVIREMLPMNEGFLYPVFTVKDGELCAHFLTCTSKRVPMGVEMSVPHYHIVVLCPEGRVVCAENLRYRPDLKDYDFDRYDIISPMTPERRLEVRSSNQEAVRLAGEVLTAWEDTSSVQLESYDHALKEVLTRKQSDMYCCILNLRNIGTGE